MKIRIAGITKESVVDGPGVRTVVFAQGCPHHCLGCHNPDTWDPRAGDTMNVQDVLQEMYNDKLATGVTFSGGEPFDQPKEFYHLAYLVRLWGKSIIIYTGYTWEELQELSKVDKDVLSLIEISDYIIDSPYIESERDLGLRYRGSRNQRVIDVQKSLKFGSLVQTEFN